MIPSFILHNSSSSERREVVNLLLEQTKATIVEAVMLENGKDGCRASHLATLRLANALHPDRHVLVLEDDCLLSDDWHRCLDGIEMLDVVYLGYNGKSETVTYGTHAVVLSPKARKAILASAETLKDSVDDKGAYDHILSRICRQDGLLTAMPPLDQKNRYATQKEGLRSLITGHLRVTSPPPQ